MASYGPNDADIVVYTFKEGLLSPVAHDLKVVAKRFSIELEGDPSSGPEGVSSITAEVDAASFEVACVMKEGTEVPGTLSPKDKSKIATNIQKDVLRTKKHGAVRFRSTEIGDGAVAGELTLHGVTRPVRWRLEGTRAVLQLNQLDFKIKPFSAMLGALKVQAQVRVEVSLRG